MKDFLVSRIPDKTWGSPLVARPVPKGTDIWGILAPLREDPMWGSLIPVVDGRTFERALLGDSMPLMRAMGLPPEGSLKQIRGDDRICVNKGTCALYDPEGCHLNKLTPECWESPLVDPLKSMAASFLTRLWRDGTYVVVVEDLEE